MAELLDVINEAGAVIGTETRAKIHREGLLHREVNIWLYTSKGQIIFQHRAKGKETMPDLLDASAGGHVEAGSSHLDTAIKELAEETGLHAKPSDLQFLQQHRVDFRDPATGAHNQALQNIYAYRYDGKLADLTIEQGKALGFEAYAAADLFQLTPAQAKRFIFPIIGAPYPEIFHQIERLAQTPADLAAPYKYSMGYIILPVTLTSLPPTITLAGTAYHGKTRYHCSLVAIKKLVPQLMSRDGLTAEQAEARANVAAIRAISELKPTFEKFIPKFRIAEKPAEHKQTLLIMARITRLGELFERINQELRLNLPVQPAHITLYTMANGANIGLTNQDELERCSRPLTDREHQDLQRQIDVRTSLGVKL